MRLFIRFFVAVFLLLLAVVIYSAYQYRAPSVAQDTVVFIAPGTGSRAILDQLAAQQVTPAPWKILLSVAFSGQYRDFKAGEYAFVKGLSPAQVLGSIARGEVIVHAVTVPEGYSVAQVRAMLMNEPLLTGDVPAGITEGSLAPDTIHFQRGDARSAIIDRLQAEQGRILREAWAARADGLPLSSPEAALTLASIVEEETGLAHERGRVAAVYINRLRKGMALQADPTVAYGIAPGGMNRLLTRNDLKRDTPYNTYTRQGLPPGPICNPGKASILAVLNPPETDELFFVATGSGGHNFSRTLAEHEANVRRYRASQRGR